MHNRQDAHACDVDLQYTSQEVEGCSVHCVYNVTQAFYVHYMYVSPLQTITMMWPH